MSSFKTPTSQQIEVASQRMRSPEFAAYFLSRLQNPEWIIPLCDCGLFANPPPAISVEGGGVRYPNWPATQYLARMAAHSPEKVATILVSIETNNPSVFRDILDAAANMPIAVAAKLVPALCKGIGLDAFWVYFPNATDLCVRLASEGQEDAALSLADALFALRHASCKGIANRDHYWYSEGLEKVVPRLTAVRPTKFLTRFCTWLHSAVENRDHFDRESGSDFSWHWRPAIEEHEQNDRYDLAGEMVGFVRQAFEQAITEGKMTFEAADAIIAKHRYVVFKRLRIHLINYFAERIPELARSVMMDRSLFDNHEFKHEYATLMSRRFLMLLLSERDVWFGWITAGPDMSHFDEFAGSGTGKEPTDADRQARVRYWQFKRLHWVRGYLECEWKHFYEEMLAEHGEPTLADLNFYHGPVRRGYESPFTVEELSALSFSEVLDKVAAWRPEPTQIYLDRPEIEGLAAAFGQFSSSRTQELSGQAEMLKGQPAIYVRTFIEQMTEAVKGGQQIDVVAVLRLCEWVVEQPLRRDACASERSRDMVDRNWQWTREGVSQFLRTMCGVMSGAVPRYSLEDSREAASTLLDRLVQDPARSYTADETERTNPRVFDFLNSAINSPRGKAVEAALQYARWVANHFKREKNGRLTVADGFNAMPEVRAMLEWQIAPENASFESFAVIGEHLGLLYWIDPSWVTTNAPRIFDLTEIERERTRACGWAAWNAFLVWCFPHIEYYRMLRSQYAYAVEHLPDARLTVDSSESPLHHLGEHLVILFGRGDLAANRDDAVMHDFLRAAPLDVRCRTIAFVGRSLGDTANVPEDVIARFMELWDWYWRELGQTDARSSPKSGLLTTWFMCKRFPDQWCLERLQARLDVAPTPEFAEPIVERIAGMSAAHIERVTRVLDRMIRADKEGWRVYSCANLSKGILKLALQGDRTVRAMAEQLIDHLGRRGYTDFGELLDVTARKQEEEHQ